MATVMHEPARVAYGDAPNGEQRLLLDGVDWQSYQSIGRAS